MLNADLRISKGSQIVKRPCSVAQHPAVQNVAAPFFLLELKLYEWQCFNMSHVSPRASGRLCVCVRVPVQRSALAPTSRCCGHAKMLPAFMARSRTRAMAANVSDTGLVNRQRLTDKADVDMEQNVAPVCLHCWQAGLRKGIAVTL